MSLSAPRIPSAKAAAYLVEVGALFVAQTAAYQLTQRPASSLILPALLALTHAVGHALVVRWPVPPFVRWLLTVAASGVLLGVMRGQPVLALVFVAIAFVLGVGFVLGPDLLRVTTGHTLRDDLARLVRYRYLVWLWSSYAVRSRYTQTVLGILWVVVLPIVEAAVLAFAFTQLLGSRGGPSGVPWVLFLMSGHVTFMIFQKTVNNGQQAIRRNSRIIESVYFPREVLIIVTTAEVLIDFTFALIGFVLLGWLMYGYAPTVLYWLLPLPIVLLFALALGVSFALAWLGLVIRDIQQLIGISLQMLFYMTVLFNPNSAPDDLRLRWLVLNPLAAFVESFRDVVLYRHAPDLSLLWLPAALSLSVLVGGYVLYRINENQLTDYL